MSVNTDDYNVNGNYLTTSS